MFGGIPSFLHIHHVHVKDGPELHLHKADQPAPALGTLQKELLIHESKRQEQEQEQEQDQEPEAAALRGSSEQKLHRSQDSAAAASMEGRNGNLRRRSWALCET